MTTQAIAPPSLNYYHDATLAMATTSVRAARTSSIDRIDII
jgi:hypothetical protein